MTDIFSQAEFIVTNFILDGMPICRWYVFSGTGRLVVVVVVVVAVAVDVAVAVAVDVVVIVIVIVVVVVVIVIVIVITAAVECLNRDDDTKTNGAPSPLSEVQVA